MATEHEWTCGDRAWFPGYRSCWSDGTVHATQVLVDEAIPESDIAALVRLAAAVLVWDPNDPESSSYSVELNAAKAGVSEELIERVKR